MKIRGIIGIMKWKIISIYIFSILQITGCSNVEEKALKQPIETTPYTIDNFNLEQKDPNNQIIFKLKSPHANLNEAIDLIEVKESKITIFIEGLESIKITSHHYMI